MPTDHVPHVPCHMSHFPACPRHLPHCATCSPCSTSTHIPIHIPIHALPESPSGIFAPLLLSPPPPSLPLPLLLLQFHRYLLTSAPPHLHTSHSLSAKTLEDNLECFARASNTEGVASIEYNLACPNIIGKPIIAYDFDQLTVVLEALAGHDDIGKKPLGVKLPPYVDEHLYNIQCSEIFTLRNEKLHTET